MRVLLLSWEYPPVMVGGLGRHVHSLSTELVRAGHDVTVVTRHEPGAALDEYASGVRVVRVPEDPPLFPLSTPTLLAWTMAFNHTLTRAALRVAQTTKFDVIHAHDWLVAYTAITVKEQLDIPLVTTIHATEAGRHQGWLPGELNKAIHSVEWWLVHESSRVVVCSHYMGSQVNRLLEAPHGKIDVIPNGVESESWEADPNAIALARQRYCGDGPMIGFAGRLVYEKGVQDIVNAMPALRDRHPGTRLVIAGDGPHKGELLEEVRRLDLGHDVLFVGFLGEQLAALMAATNVMVVPSIYEPFGMIALEAAAAGVPVAAAATGGLAEIVDPGLTGITFPAGNPGALADAVSYLLSNEGAAKEMADNAKKIVADRYAWSTIAARTVGVYKSAIAEAPAFYIRQAARTLINGRPRLVVPEGNLL